MPIEHSEGMEAHTNADAAADAPAPLKLPISRAGYQASGQSRDCILDTEKARAAALAWHDSSATSAIAEEMQRAALL